MDVNKNKILLKELLLGEITQNTKQKIAETDSVEKALHGQWTESVEQAIDIKEKERIWKNINKKRKGINNKVHIPLWSTLAACASILLVIGSFWYISDYSKKTNDNIIEIVANKNQVHTLPDESKVWMEPGSRLKYSKVFNGNREVWLSGNALFEVRKQQGNKFGVYIENAHIEVKGTTFRIEQKHPDKSCITLFSGSVAFHAESSPQEIEMKPMQKLIFNPQDATTNVQSIPDLHWKDGRFYFTDIPLDKFIDIINQINDSDIVLGNGIKNSSIFTGSIRYNESADEIADKLCFSLNLKKKEKQGKIIIIHN